MKLVVLAIAVALGAAGAATAAPVYRCGQSYSQTPCPGGTLIDAADPRSAAQRAEARRVAAREKKLADQMEQDRRDREAGAPPAEASGFHSKASAPAPAASAKPGKPKGKKKSSKAGTTSQAASSPDFVAVEPAKPKPKK